jgi:hydroxymethylpyrimidine/phosphomethylpyrimidine kinase
VATTSDAQEHATVQARVLIIAGSDSGGGAGIQADIKTVTALGGYAATAITALTAQNTTGVYGVHGTPPDFIRQQIRLVLDDIGADAIKTGMLHSAAVIDVVCEAVAGCVERVPLVVDPVMVAKGGASLLDESAVATLKSRLIPQAAVITPNLPEAEVLTGRTIRTMDDRRRAAADLLEFGCGAVLLKGGHSDDAMVTDVLAERDGSVTLFRSRRINTRHTHGTGCTLASGIATGLAQGLRLKDAVARARAYVLKALRTAPGLGAGHGPLNHGHTVRPFGRLPGRH